MGDTLKTMTFPYQEEKKPVSVRGGINKWKLVSSSEDSHGFTMTTRILVIPSKVGCLVHTSTVRLGERGLLSEALTFVPGVGPEHFEVVD